MQFNKSIIAYRQLNYKLCFVVKMFEKYINSVLQKLSVFKLKHYLKNGQKVLFCFTIHAACLFINLTLSTARI